MTVAELIAALQKLPQDLPVLADGDSYFYDPAVRLNAHGNPDDPTSEKYVRIFPAD